MGGSRGVGHVWWTPGKYATDPPPLPGKQKYTSDTPTPLEKSLDPRMPFFSIIMCKEVDPQTYT